ncbi:putative membrane protein [Desulfobaculum xiamenense]|uniref:Putative membrane protein n=1 Tax=Desulfobaculum xiamenense TaxID=995050 RepID=A0A846QPA9_9BACT|nr:hypothetical protein [Desulfobaculum xiamenense]NJB68322.1 putative membrane protein [Desulfobaculum xiamenense]
MMAHHRARRILRVTQSIFVGMLLGSLVLSTFHSRWWLALTATSALYLLHAAATGIPAFVPVPRQQRK